ncbi:MAG: tail fiber protein [Dysgonomonas sp.]|uniref:tail fiber protein n=1 Tax=Dysgonomonas sp. TaxID=1891233 RepID=UPI0039E3D0B1
MNKGNFTATQNFPVSTYTYDFLQQMAHLAGKLAALGGANYILSGCAVAGNNVSDGVVVINGEILPFTGGVLKNKLTIKEVKLSDNFAGINYPESYILRTVEFSDTGQYNWSDFAQVLTNKQLEAKINSIKSEAPGFVKPWSGLIERLPSEYKLCNGDIVTTEEYPDLAYFYGKENEQSFRLPDLRKRFIVGYDNSSEDYNEIGKTGGEEFHELTEDENAPHKHIVPWGENLNTAWKPDWGYPDDRFNNSRGYKADTDNDNTWPYTSPSGKGDPHENRPPFYTLAYVVRVKY